MTGTGTQTDPYIADTWSNFVSAVNNTSAYVKIPENTVWDMNEILPDGLTNYVKVRCNEIEGNFAEIRNLRVSASKIFCFYASTNVNRLNLLNITDTTYNSSRYWFDSEVSGSGEYVNFRNCVITGLITSGFFSYGSSYRKIRFTNDETKGCTINLLFEGNAKLNASYTEYSNSLIELGGKSSESNIEFANFENCYIQGECPWGSVSVQSTAANIFDMEIGTISSNSSSSIYKQNIVNKDKVKNLGNYAQCLTLVTEAQLHDAEYLKSVGFPIL